MTMSESDLRGGGPGRGRSTESWWRVDEAEPLRMGRLGGRASTCRYRKPLAEATVARCATSARNTPRPRQAAESRRPEAGELGTGMELHRPAAMASCRPWRPPPPLSWAGWPARRGSPPRSEWSPPNTCSWTDTMASSPTGPAPGPARHPKAVARRGPGPRSRLRAAPRVSPPRDPRTASAPADRPVGRRSSASTPTLARPHRTDGSGRRSSVSPLLVQVGPGDPRPAPARRHAPHHPRVALDDAVRIVRFGVATDLFVEGGQHRVWVHPASRTEPQARATDFRVQGP